jgi:selenocysteine lyase/cysteine desulfurase
MLTCKHGKFTLPPKITYLNCAYMSPMLKSVEKAGIRGLKLKRNPVSISPSDFFTGGDVLRQEYAKLINAGDSRRIVIIPSVSYGISTVAANLKISKGQHIIVASEQFPSNYYPWARLCEEQGGAVKPIAPPEQMDGRGKIWNERILDAIDHNTAAVAIAHTHWADGTKFDLVAIRKRTRDVGALLVIDGTQSVGALPFDVQLIQPDVLICGGYKWLLGPYSIGLAYFGDYFNDGKPIEESWMNRLNSEDFSSLINYQPNYQPGALRYEVGEHSNFVLVPMMTKAIEQLNKWKPENIQAYCQSITRNSISKLRELGFWVEDEAYRGHHLIGLRLPKHLDMTIVKETLLKNKIYVSFRGNAIRVAPNVYNDEDDLAKLVSSLKRVK